MLFHKIILGILLIVYSTRRGNIYEILESAYYIL